MGTTFMYWAQFVIAVGCVLEMLRGHFRCKELDDLIRYASQYKIDEYQDKVEKMQSIRERICFRIGLIMARIALKCRWCSGLFAILASMLWYLLLDIWTALFVVALFILYFGHWAFFPLLDYMESPHKLLYYAIPIAIFIAVIAYEFHKCQGGDDREKARQDDDWIGLKKAVAIAVLVSFPIAVTCNDWHGAYEKHVQQLKHDLGDDWEDYMDEYRIDAMAR